MKKMLLLLTALSLCAFAEDIELYIGEVSQRTGNRPQVLIIFDNSGSMKDTIDVKQSYDPNTVYPAIGGYNSLSDKFIYFTKGTGVDDNVPVPDSPSEQRRFLDDINSCNTARQILETEGVFHGHLREYSFSGNTGSWQEIPDNNGANIEVIDCWEDIIEQDPNNAGVVKNNGTLVNLPDGYPVDGQGTKGNPVYHSANLADSNTAFGLGEIVTLYTDNYLRWHQSEVIGSVESTRLQVAKDSIATLLNSAPSADFGIQIFNLDYPGEFARDGGRIIAGIQTTDDTARAGLIDTISNFNAETNTPLCESLYEAAQYFGGKPVDFGNNDSNYNPIGYKGNRPSRDTSIESAGNYISPFKGCGNDVYVILMTDGKPTEDLAADSKIQALKNSANPALTATPFDLNGTESYLPVLAQWMNTNDINSYVDGDQHATIFTIGFGNEAITDAGQLLSETANMGGGQYFEAEDSASLVSSLQTALIEILKVNSSFTSPSVASDNFDRTQTLDSVYYTMFLPDRGPRWAGNLKKLKLENDIQVDRTGTIAIDNSGNIDSDAKTFWTNSATPDGNEVKLGGVAEVLSTSNVNRKLLSNLGTNGALVDLSKASAVSYFGSDAALAAYMNVAEEDIQSHLDWATGIDVDDENKNNLVTDYRSDLFADPLHSKPLVLNFGGSNTNQDVRILVGTNAGAFHMFDDNGNSIDESWAFMPNEFFSNIKPLRENYSNTEKIYGVDGSPAAYLKDTDGDGSIVALNGDKAWVYFGLRRGGSSYYAMDITNPDSPSLKWHINSNTAGFSRLGQSWSQPHIINIQDVNSGTAKPAVVIGGGYSVNKDIVAVGTADTVGNAIYIVDADTGSLLWSASPDATTSKNTQVTTLQDSIPARIASLDSDGDGITDRLYASDTGGNIWRVDMPSKNPFDNEAPWTVIQLASLGGNTLETDRRFFSEPTVARSYFSKTTTTTLLDTNGDPVLDGQGNQQVSYQYEEVPFEAVLIGSGNRVYPTQTNVDDKLFMIRDESTITQSFTSQTTPSVIEITNLVDYSANPYGEELTDDAKGELDLAVSSGKGWFVDLDGGGEKSLSSPTVVAGVAYYTSFTPSEESAAESCTLASGGGLLYALDLHLGTTIYNWRTLDIGDKVPDTPTVVIPPSSDENEPNKLLFVGVGEGEGGGTLILCAAGENCDPEPCEGDSCPEKDVINLETMRTYLYMDESGN